MPPFRRINKYFLDPNNFVTLIHFSAAWGFASRQLQEYERERSLFVIASYQKSLAPHKRASHLCVFVCEQLGQSFVVLL
jgi:hypothetical protein